MAIESHIQVPKFILKRFRGTTGKVAYLSLEDRGIHYCSADKLGTQTDYYSEEMEQFLNKEVETPLSKLVVRASQFAAGKCEEISFTEQEEEICRRFVRSSMARSELAIQEMKNVSVTAMLYIDQQNRDDLVYFGSSHEGLGSQLEGYKLYRLVNI